MTQSALAIELLASELPSDARELLEQLGSPEALPSLPLAASALTLEAVRDAATLRRFLAGYREQVLLPVELPAILAAHGHACRGELRELVSLDRALAADPRLREFRAASAAVGRRQLSKLRPLRDQRLVQRYLRAVENGEAHGWHTLVFGVFLAQYSLPPRQGLVLYGHRTLGGFVASAGASLRLPISVRDDVFAEAAAPVTDAVNGLLAAEFPSNGFVAK
ncbi:MAG: UreF [Verrucomicrobiota bacterium]|jgi:urease accessory protein UreF